MWQPKREGSLGAEWIHVYVWLSPFAVYLKLTQHWLLISYGILSRSVVSDSVITWTAAYQAPLSMVFSRQEYRSGQPLPSLGDLLDPGIDPWSLASQADFLPSELPGKTLIYYTPIHNKKFFKKTIQTNEKEKTKIK